MTDNSEILHDGWRYKLPSGEDIGILAWCVICTNWREYTAAPDEQRIRRWTNCENCPTEQCVVQILGRATTAMKRDKRRKSPLGPEWCFADSQE